MSERAGAVEREMWRRVRAYNATADAAWEDDPKQAMRDYGLPCWHGHYGGCPEAVPCE